MSDYIRTFSGINFFPLSPKKEDIRIEDIAHALSLMVRANGHFPEFYSVAQHCIACCKESIACGYSDRIVFACLLHDAAEAYMSDVTRPIKKHLELYKSAENTLLSMIYEAFIGHPLSQSEQETVAMIDDAMLYHEFLHYTDVKISACHYILKQSPEFRFIDFKQVEAQYLELFHSFACKM